jgi:protein transport protein SEC23
MAEMQHMVTCTGGFMVMAETYEHDVLRHSLARLFRSDEDGAALDWAMNGTLEVLPGSHLASAGAIGPLASLERKSAATAAAQIGLGDTTLWKMNSLNASTTVALFFQPIATRKEAAPTAGTPLYFQVRLLSVTTCALCLLW